ncbi:MAG: peptide chain release factor 2 [Candidatus Marinimicrobia bacterium]|nr:peptide chain release factor 2 [Candidatus Neomarinimicrobiota bacterium]
MFDTTLIQNEINSLEVKTHQQDFWLNSEKAKNILKEISHLKSHLSFIGSIDSSYEELEMCIEFIEDEVDDEYIVILKKFSEKLDEFEIKNILNNEDDARDAIISIHPGAGGTESQDWAEMLYRMYSRWIEKKKFKSKLLDYQQGDEAGIKDVSIEVNGKFSYGYLKSEMGVHRLVRISPFDSNGKRHTSFASVFVYPVIDDEIDVEINDKDIKIDTYRASGAGGQHVNKTDSAVRITHLPTSIVVQCQNERSQLKNKNTAMKILKSKLYQKVLDERKKDFDNFSGDKKEIAWGSQIRSYVFHPYSLIKDHRTDAQTSNISLFMDGDIDLFIKQYLIKNMEINNSER